MRVKNQSRLQEFYSRNLSSGGIYLEIPNDPPAVGSKLTLTFEIPGLGKSFSADAEVVHQHSFESMDENFTNTARHGVGLRFINLRGEDEKLIQKFITGKDLRVSS